MRAETSKQQENTSSQLIRKIAEGKRKGESYGPALSLQDVFSDSANLEGMQQKTSCQSEIGQEKGAQLEKHGERKPNKISKGGRRQLHQDQKRRIKLQMHVTKMEYEKLKDQFRSTGIRYLSDYLRLLILDKRRAGQITNKKELIRQLDGLGTQISKTGNNINQIAKYANIQVKSDKVDRNTLINFNQEMAQYLTLQQELTKAYRALIRSKG
jgi:hypothetical protein